MGVPAENAVGFLEPRVKQRSGSHFCRHAQPSRVQAVDEARDRFALQIQALQLQVEQGPQVVQAERVDDELVELMTVDRQMLLSVKLPNVFLVHPYSDQMRHDVGQALVVIAFDPDDLDVAFGIGEFADIAEEFPVFLGEPAKIEVGKNVAQKNEPAEPALFEQVGRFLDTAALRPKMYVGEDQRIVDGRIHTPTDNRAVLRGDEHTVNER